MCPGFSGHVVHFSEDIMFLLLEKLLMLKDLDPRPSLGSARDPTGERGVVPVDTKLLADIEASLAALTVLKALARACWPP